MEEGQNNSFPIKGCRKQRKKLSELIDVELYGKNIFMGEKMERKEEKREVKMSTNLKNEQ